MKDVALLGIPGSGTSTVFRAVSGSRAARGAASARAVVDVPDERLAVIARIYGSAKVTYSQVQLVDVPSLEARALGEARAADALAIVLRAWGPDAEPVRDLERVSTELVVLDLATVEKVRERLRKRARTPAERREVEVAERAESVLSAGRWLSSEPWTPEEERTVSLWTPLTLKPVVHVVNAEEPVPPPEGIGEPCVVVCGALEAEAAELAPEEGAALLRELGIAPPASVRFLQAAYRALGLVTFYTGGPTEARAWATRRGSRAPEAAGVIHSDFERGFIRAERVSYEDLVRLGSEKAAREAGVLRVEGKDYVVREGDVLHILHSA